MKAKPRKKLNALDVILAMNHMGGDHRGGYCICPCKDGSAPDGEHSTNCANARTVLMQAGKFPPSMRIALPDPAQKSHSTPLL